MIHCAMVSDEAQNIQQDFCTNVNRHGHNINITMVQASNNFSLSTYDIVVFGNGVQTEHNFSTRCDPELYNFIMQQKSVILCAFSNKSNINYGLENQIPAIHPLTYSVMQGGREPLMMNILDSYKLHPLFAGVHHVEIPLPLNTVTHCNVAKGAIEYARWNNNATMVAERKMSVSHSVIALNLHPTSSAVHSGNMKPESDGFRLIYNAIVYCAGLKAQVLHKQLAKAKQFVDIVFYF